MRELAYEALVKTPSRKALKEELLAVLAQTLDTLEAAHADARAGATHEQAKPENDKDTRALEQSYLARGQAMRVEELTASVVEVQNMPLRGFRDTDPVALGALVTVHDGDEPRSFFMAPQGEGSTLAGSRIQVVTPRSPVGRALLGKRVGDECALKVADKSRELEVVAIA